ncbi:GNAT family N-acetyltransferase [uncultured Streptomyces sp.]|uniref:GNAT family N-acetyltransferase n=1 Tax=uncultured Streptomyces sp. TaxID=174707 RepID=UPI0026077674|nr:GNAT family N-acetyltransferase [uncultured Streptomyces sp.]
MTWTFTEDVTVFLDAAGAALAARPAENTLLLTVTAKLRDTGPGAYGTEPPLLGWWCAPDGEVAGTLVQTPPFPPILGASAPEAAVALLDALALPGVNADRGTATVFTARWPRHRVEEELRLYRLGTLVPPTPPPAGRGRVATLADRDLLVDWIHAFGQEIGQPAGRARTNVDERVSRGGLTLWEVDGEPVSLAGLSPRLAGMVRVTTVYTPPEHRGRGYAAAVTARVSAAAREEGAREVLLFTDLANPTSNGVYRRIGYEAVSDRLVITADSG